MAPTTTPILPEGYTLQIGYPDIPSYLRLRSASGLTPKSPAQAAPIPSNSWYGCYITFDGAPVAIGRIIGDGGWYFHIADMATLPDHQRKGLGQVVLRELLAYIGRNAPHDETKGECPYVTLFADGPGRRLYEKHGFKEAAPKQMGMQIYDRKVVPGDWA
jgi:GNAT superfamily N-acetyltransferase